MSDSIEAMPTEGLMSERYLEPPPGLLDVASVLQYLVGPAFFHLTCSLHRVGYFSHPTVVLQHPQELRSFHAGVGLALSFTVVEQVVFDYNVDVICPIPGDNTVD